MPLYESTFIARPDVSTQQMGTLGEQFNEVIRAGGGEVASSEQWGLRNLTYRINKNRKGHYVHMRIEAPSDAIVEMERTMRRLNGGAGHSGSGALDCPAFSW